MQRSPTILTQQPQLLTIGVLCLQGAFIEHRRSIERLNHVLKSESTMNHENEKDSLHCHQIELEVVEVRTKEDMYRSQITKNDIQTSGMIDTNSNNVDSFLDGLIIPGGESTSMIRLLRDHDRSGLLDALRHFVKSGKPVFGTCAGAILLSNRVVQKANEVESSSTSNNSNLTQPDSDILLGGIRMKIARNWYGRQLASFETNELILHKEIKRYQKELKNVMTLDSATTSSSTPPVSPSTYTTVSPQSSSAIFIRAPAILEIGDGVEILAELPAPKEHRHLAPVDSTDQSGVTPKSSSSPSPVDSRPSPVAVRDGNLIAACFHPELSTDLSFHRYFIEMCLKG